MNLKINIEENNFLSKLNTLTKIIVSIIFSTFIIFIDNKIPLLILFGASVLYVLPLKKYKLLIIAYLLIAVMFGISTFFSKMISDLMKKQSNKNQTELVENNSNKDNQIENKSKPVKTKKKTFKHPGSTQNKVSMIIPFLRTTIVINLMLALTLSSGIRKLTNVIKVLKLPRVLFLPIIIVFRFVPSFINELKQISENIKIKSGNNAAFIMIKNPKLYLRLLIIPSVIRTLSVAEELSAAAELKGLSKNIKITNSAPEKWRFFDNFIIFIAIILIILAFYLNGRIL